MGMTFDGFDALLRMEQNFTTMRLCFERRIIAELGGKVDRASHALIATGLKYSVSLELLRGDQVTLECWSPRTRLWHTVASFGQHERDQADTWRFTLRNGDTLLAAKAA